MPRPTANKAGHITHGNVLEDLGFNDEEIRKTEIKMTIWRPLRAEVEARELTQMETSQFNNKKQRQKRNAGVLPIRYAQGQNDKV